jgi:uncharacterized protein (DUF3820 family)
MAVKRFYILGKIYRWPMNKDHISRRYTKMPWGKHKGRYIKDLPDSYLAWATKPGNYEQRSLVMWFQEELDYRKKYGNK